MKYPSIFRYLTVLQHAVLTLHHAVCCSRLREAGGVCATVPTSEVGGSEGALEAHPARRKIRVTKRFTSTMVPDKSLAPPVEPRCPLALSAWDSGDTEDHPGGGSALAVAGIDGWRGPIVVVSADFFGAREGGLQTRP